MERLYRVPDRMGNLFETRERDDRRYDASGQLAEDREYFYHYDCEGNSIISDYLGTPLQAYDKQGNKVWEQELDIYGRQRKRPFAFIPFKYQGQYEDAETGLYYNRFRYYDPNAGSYISQDPIGLMGENPTLYAYVSDINSLTDLLGLTAEAYKLVATKDGYYDVYEWGNDKPMGKTHLKKGDTWKIGETTNFRTKKDGTEIQNRYTKKWLRQEQFRI